MSIKTKADKLATFALVGTLVCLPVGGALVGAYYGAKEAYDVIGWAGGIWGLEKGAGGGLIAGLIGDGLIWGALTGIEKMGKSLHRRKTPKGPAPV